MKSPDVQTLLEPRMHTLWLNSGFFSRHRIEILMWALVAEMLASPLADAHPRAGALLGLAVLLMVLSCIGYMADRTIVRRVVLPVAAIWMMTRLIDAFGDRSKPSEHLSPILGLAFSCSILWAILNHFHSRSRDLRSAAAEAFICYLVIATTFSQIYWILNRFVDHAFNQTIPSTQIGTFLYFSMITLTSVGYGGIVPVNPYVRNVAAFESMCGIFFIALVVARLVSNHSPGSARRGLAMQDLFADISPAGSTLGPVSDANKRLIGEELRAKDIVLNDAVKSGSVGGVTRRAYQEISG